MPSFPRELLLPSQEAESPCDLNASITPSASGLGHERSVAELSSTDVSGRSKIGADINSLAGGLTDSESAGALLALSEHATVLRLIWEAHARGAIALPPTLARRVVQARRSIPKYLSVSSAGAFAQVTHTPAVQRDAV